LDREVVICACKFARANRTAPPSSPFNLFPKLLHREAFRKRSSLPLKPPPELQCAGNPDDGDPMESSYRVQDPPRLILGLDFTGLFSRRLLSGPIFSLHSRSRVCVPPILSRILNDLKPGAFCLFLPGSSSFPSLIRPFKGIFNAQRTPPPPPQTSLTGVSWSGTDQLTPLSPALCRGSLSSKPLDPPCHPPPPPHDVERTRSPWKKYLGLHRAVFVLLLH